MEAFTGKAQLRGVEDLLATAFQVFFADSGHVSKVKRMSVLDNFPAPCNGVLIERERTFDFREIDMNTTQRALAVGLGAALLKR